MKRVEFTIRNDTGELLQEPGFVEECSDLPLAIMRAVEDFLDAHDQKLHLPLIIHIKPGAGASLC